MRPEAWIAFFVLAAFIGFFADRTSICTVKAIEEILTARRAYMLLSFGKTVLWVIGITVWLVWWLGADSPDQLAFGIAWTSLLGGLLFGIGAVFNTGCAFATVKRLGNGNLGMLVTISGFAAGIATFELLGDLTSFEKPHRTEPWFELGFGFSTPIGILLTVWMIWEVVRLWRSSPDQRRWTFWSAPRFRLSTAAVIIGVSNGILYGLLGTWSYTHTFSRSVRHLLTADIGTAGYVPIAMLWWLFLALVAGVITSAALNRRFVLAWRPTGNWNGYFWGGALMGLGAALVPGGNDVLLLNAIPGMSPHAIPAYFSMLVGVLAGLFIVRWRGKQWDVIDCRGDLCRGSDGRQPN